jgi:UDPglucose--hexose-1-phosphate uridylyltransferase
MPEIRQNIVTREWSIIATERARRPEQFVRPEQPRIEQLPEHDPTCPFCPGNEEIDLERMRVPAAGDWQLRVVRNKYPALRDDLDAHREIDGIHHSIGGLGFHEVVVETRLHNRSPAIEQLDEVERTLRAFQQRAESYRQNAHIEHIVFFKNHGPTAGTSLIHPHAQIVALPVVPSSIRQRSEEARRYFDDQGVCVLCWMLAHEEREQVRIIHQTSTFTAFVPYAAFSPFHCWIVPRRHTASFADADAGAVRDLAAILQNVLRRLYYGLNDPDYNYVFRSAPESERYARHLHWYVSIVPRVSQAAGFELGTGMFINTSLPEESARFLREQQPPAAM